ncbi:MAG: hypothetical protein U0704_02760 [Candidatus Eisenbacteria bacterium]
MRLVWSFLLLCCVLVAAPARAAVRLDVPTGGTLRAGETIELRWEGLDPGIREVEFELSLDGGRWIRISPELDALEGRWTWHVPSLAAEHARLRLRCGGEHRETVAATSGAFALAARPGDDREFLGEWWPALDRHACDTAPAGLASRDVPVLAAAATIVQTDVPGAPGLVAPSDSGSTLDAPGDAPLPTGRSLARSARPAFVPMRN